MAGPEGVSGKRYERVKPTQQLASAKKNVRPSWPVIVLDQYRADVAGSIIRPTAISVPSVLNAASKFSTKSSMNACSISQGRLVCASKNVGSHVLMIRGRRRKAKDTSVTVATPPTSIMDASSMPKIDPNRKLFSGTAEPAADRMKIPAAKAIR